MRQIALNTKIIKLLMEEPTVRLLTITPFYLLMLLLNVGPVAMVHAIGVASLMSGATVLLMGKSVTSVKALITSKPFVIQRLQQPRQCPALTGGSTLTSRGGHLRAAMVAVAKEEAGSSRRRRRPRNTQSRKHTRLHSKTRSYQK